LFGPGAQYAVKKVLGPVNLAESSFTLKMAVTFLISGFISVFYLIPFYFLGTAWWRRGAGEFLNELLNLNVVFPNLTLVFSWPLLRLNLQAQFFAGLGLAAATFFLKNGKAVLRFLGPALRFESPALGTWEKSTLSWFSRLSWKVFRIPQSVAQAAVENSIAEHSQYIHENRHAPLPLQAAAVCCVGCGFIGCCLPVYSAVSKGSFRTKVFTNTDNDNAVRSFCLTEESLNFDTVHFIKCQITGDAFEMLEVGCPWIIIQRIEGCDCLGNVSCLSRCPGLEVADFNGCKGITGEVSSSTFILTFHLHTSRK